MSSVKCCPLEESLCRPKTKQSCKVTCQTECDPVVCCPTVPEVDPCACEQPMDCCSLAYQRLDKLRSIYAGSAVFQNSIVNYNIDSNASGNTFNVDDVVARNGSSVRVPDATLFQKGSEDVTAFFPTLTGSGQSLPTVGGVDYCNGALAYNFVQTMRYLPSRDVICDTGDQVMGFYINPYSVQLQVLQNLVGPLNPLGLTFSDTLQYYNTIPPASLTNSDKQKLASLNILYDLGLEAIRRFNLNPKTEGNMVELCDRCGQRWLLVLNTADVPSASGYQPGLNGYVLVATRLPPLLR